MTNAKRRICRSGRQQQTALSEPPVSDSAEIFRHHDHCTSSELLRKCDCINERHSRLPRGSYSSAAMTSRKEEQRSMLNKSVLGSAIQKPLVTYIPCSGQICTYLLFIGTDIGWDSAKENNNSFSFNSLSQRSLYRRTLVAISIYFFT